MSYNLTRNAETKNVDVKRVRTNGFSCLFDKDGVVFSFREQSRKKKLKFYPLKVTGNSVIVILSRRSRYYNLKRLRENHFYGEKYSKPRCSAETVYRDFILTN